jgi:2-dehydro-3-deoxyphosphogluconate aldolase/(4S)-4-hydroxy-2-oxoglutarate aldolase
MSDINVKEVIEAKKIIAIIRGVDEKDAAKVVDALINGGINLLEFTFDHGKPNCIQATATKIKSCKEQFGEKVIVGAGTVLTVEEAERAIEAGAEFIISPNVNTDVIRKTKELGKISIPGATTPTEAIIAYEAGSDYIKLFPAGELGINYIKALMAPLMHIPFMVVGGITPDNCKSFLDLGVKGIGVGGQLINKNAIKEGKYSNITETAKKFTESI